MLDCGSSSILIISNTDMSGFPSGFTINGSNAMIASGSAYFVPCRGSIDTTGYTYITYKVLPTVNPTVNFSAPFSLLAGLLVALAFVVMSLRRI